MLYVNDQLSVPLKELEFTYSCSGGPGGQNVNKVASKATLRWSVARTTVLPPDVKARLTVQNRRRLTTEGDLLLTSQRFRDQGRNVADCLEKLRVLLLAAFVKPVDRRPTKPTKASHRRRLDDKRHRAERKSGRRTPADE